MMISGTFSEFADPCRECTKHDILCQNISGKIMCKVHKLLIVVVEVERHWLDNMVHTKGSLVPLCI